MATQHFDEDNWFDGVVQNGMCYGTGPVVFQKATYAHGILSGAYSDFNCFFTTEGEYHDGKPWGVWQFTPKHDPHCASRPLPASIPSITLVNGTGVWSKVLDGLPSEEGILVNGNEEGLWRFRHVDEKGFSVAGTFVHGAMEGKWNWYVGSDMPGSVLKSGDLKAQYTFSQNVPDGPFIVYSPETGARVEGAVAGGLPNIPCVTASFNPHSYFDVGFDFPPSTPGGGSWPSATPRREPNTMPPAPGKMVGVWSFYDRAGRLLGENNLGDSGKGPFVLWNSNGDKVCEGQVIDGVQDGNWTMYDTGNRPTRLIQWDHGRLINNQPIPLQPPSEIH
jgi:antitoxin component YwqK of YwqJK toxin-antitoxin module